MKKSKKNHKNLSSVNKQLANNLKICYREIRKEVKGIISKILALVDKQLAKNLNIIYIMSKI